MRFLHTADWHLCDRLGRQDRTEDLRRNVERIAQLLFDERIDVLIIAGDLFSERARPEELREAIDHWNRIFGPFLQHGGTILAVTGNHDNETFCRTLNRAMSLAAPFPEKSGSRVFPGRLYLATEPSVIRLVSSNQEPDLLVYFMPYPTSASYLEGQAIRRFATIEEKNRELEKVFGERLHRLQTEVGDNSLPTLLIAHVQLQELQPGSQLFKIEPSHDVAFTVDLFESFNYVALGHIHRAQAIRNRPHIRYSGSIEKMDLGEKNDEKSVVVFEMTPEGFVSEPVLHPLPSTNIEEIHFHDIMKDLTRLDNESAKYDSDLVNLQVYYRPGEDNLDEILLRLEAIYPRWYDRDWHEINAIVPDLGLSESTTSQSFETIIREYVQQQIETYPETEQKEVLTRLEQILQEEAS
jgi:DNA repair protein SbcD/Mre11